MMTQRLGRTSSVGSRRRRVASALHFGVVAYVLTVLVLGANIPTPLYGIYRVDFGFSSFTQTAIFAIYAAGLVPALLFFGPLSDNFGRRLVLWIAVVVALCSAVLMIVADSTGLLLLGRALQGVSIGAASAAGVAALTEYERRNDRSKAAIVATVTTVLGAALGPVFGGALAQYWEPALRVPYLGFLILLVPALAMLAFLPSVRGDRARKRAYFTKPAVPAGVRRVFWAVSSRVAVAWGAVGLFQSIIPAWVATSFDIDNLVFVGGIAALVMLWSVGAQVSTRTMNAVRIQRFGLVAIGIGMATLLIVDVFPHPIPLLISASAVGIGHGLTFSAGLRQLNLELDGLATNNDGSVMAAFLTVAYTGMAVPSLGAGVFVSLIGLTTALAAFTIVGLLLCCLGLWTMGHSLRRSQEIQS